MSSSSVYNNVLLKSPVQTQAAAVPKRDFQNDYSAADFSQTFNDVRDNAHDKIERSTKRVTDKKAASVENVKSPNETRYAKKPVKESNPVEKNRDTDSVDAGEHPVAKDKKIGQKATSTKETKKCEESEESNEELLANPNLPTPDATAIPLAITVVPSLEALESETSAADAAALLVDPSNVSTNASLSAENSISTDLVNNPITSDVSNSPENLIPTSENISAVVAGALKAPGSLEGDATTENSGEQGLITEALGTDKAAVKSVKDIPAQESLAKTDATQSAVTEDPKSVFEKMLQAVAKTGAREEGAPATPLQNSTSNSQPSLTDSFARFNDAQTPAARSFVVQTAVAVPVGQPQWSQAVGEKVLWLAAQNVSSAEINLHPKDLGPIQVKVSVNQEQTSVSFTSHHPMVREVLDQNLNRLRDMFSEQGLNLVNVDVSDKSFSRQQGEGKEQKGQSGNGNANEEETITAVTTIIQQRLVDHYA